MGDAVESLNGTGQGQGEKKQTQSNCNGNSNGNGNGVCNGNQHFNGNDNEDTSGNDEHGSTITSGRGHVANGTWHVAMAVRWHSSRRGWRSWFVIFLSHAPG